MALTPIIFATKFNHKPKINTKMNIFHYRKTDYEGDPWDDLIITGKTDLSDLKSKSIVTINGQTVLRQHSITYLTGRDTCHAHHFAKMLTAAVLSGSYDRAPGLSVNVENLQQGSVLWLDSVHGIHACADFFDEMITAFDPKHERFSLLCLDKLGSFRYEFYGILKEFERAVMTLKPELIVIDDIDHLMPYCGINVASAFNHAIRDIINHSETACLFIGYNHLGKRASTTGNLGTMLFPSAYNIFSVTTQHAISTVKLIKSFNAQSNLKAQFCFTIDDDNLPHEVIKSVSEPYGTSYMQQNTLRDIIGDVIKPGETISPDDLFDKINSRRQQLNRHDRTRTIIAQAAQLGIIKKTDDNSNDYTLAAPSAASPLSTLPPLHSEHELAPSLNNSLTLPPHPSNQSDTAPSTTTGDRVSPAATPVAAPLTPTSDRVSPAATPVAAPT